MKVSVLAAVLCLVASTAYGQLSPWQNRSMEERRLESDNFMRRMEEDRRWREQERLQREQLDRLKRIEEEQQRQRRQNQPNSFR